MGRFLRLAPMFFALIAVLTVIVHLVALTDSRASMAASHFDPAAASAMFTEQILRVVLSPVEWIAWGVVTAMLIRIYDLLAMNDGLSASPKRD